MAKEKGISEKKGNPRMKGPDKKKNSRNNSSDSQNGDGGQGNKKATEASDK